MKLTDFFKIPLDHSLNPKQVQKFITASEPDVRSICKKILDITMHISFEFFLKRLNICINELFTILNPNRPIFVYMKITYNYKSEHWLCIYLNEYIKFKFSRDITIINSINTDNIINNDIIIFIDDCIYSGNNIGLNIRSINNKDIIDNGFNTKKN